MAVKLVAHVCVPNKLEAEPIRVELTSLEIADTTYNLGYNDLLPKDIANLFPIEGIDPVTLAINLDARKKYGSSTPVIWSVASDQPKEI